MLNSKEIQKIFNKFRNRWESLIDRNFKESYLIHLWGSTLAWSEILASNATKNDSAQTPYSQMSGMTYWPILFFNQT